MNGHSRQLGSEQIVLAKRNEALTKGGSSKCNYLPTKRLRVNFFLETFRSDDFPMFFILSNYTPSRQIKTVEHSDHTDTTQDKTIRSGTDAAVSVPNLSFNRLTSFIAHKINFGR